METFLVEPMEIKLQPLRENKKKDRKITSCQKQNYNKLVSDRYSSPN